MSIADMATDMIIIDSVHVYDTCTPLFYSLIPMPLKDVYLINVCASTFFIVWCSLSSSV